MDKVQTVYTEKLQSDLKPLRTFDQCLDVHKSVLSSEGAQTIMLFFRITSYQHFLETLSVLITI